MDRVSQLIPKVLSKRGLKDQAGASHAVYRAIDWLHSQSSSLGEQCIITTLQDGVLTIECQNSIAMQEMQALSEKLKEELNRISGVCVQRIAVIRSTKSTN